MNKDLCGNKACFNYGKYWRLCGHSNYTVPKKKEVAVKSEKQKKAEKEYSKVRQSFLKDNQVCLAALEGCTKKATQVHHKAGRIGDKLTDVSLFFPVCFHCHEIIEKNPAYAKAMGFSVSRHAKI